jgi:hypothetical protein
MTVKPLWTRSEFNHSEKIWPENGTGTLLKHISILIQNNTIKLMLE